jgi:hypothetical protein
MRLLALSLAVLLSGCTTFEVTYRDGTVVRQSGAPLVSRKDSFRVTHEWLDAETNTLHQVTVERNTDENASAQLEALRYAFAAGKAAAP